MTESVAYGLMSAVAAGVSFGVAALLGKKLIPWLRKLKYGQTIKEIGPAWHASKQGTPTMGGIVFIIGIVGACVIALPVFSALIPSMSGAPRLSTLKRVYIWAGVVMALLYGAIGFLDDYISVVKKRNTGLTPWPKYLLQLGAAAAYLAAVWIGGDRGEGLTLIPFVGEVQLGVWFYIISLVVITGFVNGVNLTDGIDGLCSSVTFFAMVILMLTAGFMQQFDMGIIAAATAGGCVGFLVWNFFPAKVFMGDTGSLFLGGMFCAVAYGIRMPVLIPLVGIIYLAEAGSVIVQRYYYKLTHGKRIFKMSPLHHHFEMCGWSEVKIVSVFSTVTVIGGVIAALAVAAGLR
ncbi:MAG: phospho-N-acetylmuramoyl-pentapeptide-transferase [Ruminococcaceae bacterium]|nr:phospho-N-acetylmuramoyl-pentapeptide-transferase [Oscillospiraceae bacterium]